MTVVNLDILRRLRKQHDFTMLDVARILGYSSGSCYWRIENGHVPLKASHLKDLAVLYKLQMEDFFTKRKEVVDMPFFDLKDKTNDQLLAFHAVIFKYQDNITNHEMHLSRINKLLKTRGVKVPAYFN